MWAYLIQLGKHKSFQDPPDKPYFRGRKRPISTSGNESTAKLRAVLLAERYRFVQS